MALPDQGRALRRGRARRQPQPAYGQDYKFRTWCDHRKIGYVVAVPRSQSIRHRWTPGYSLGSRRADDLVAQASEQAWKHRSADPGAKGSGSTTGRWPRSTPPTTPHPAGDAWLLARRQILTTEQLEQDKTPEIAYYLCAGPPGTTDEDLIRVAGARWAIEECFQTAKTEVGLDQYQVRRYDAWYRHVTLALLAHTYLAVTAAIALEDVVAASSRSPSARFAVSWHT